MSRYFTKPRTASIIRPERPRCDWYDDDGPMVPDVSAPEHVETDTGLLNANGDTIWRSPRPVGFGRDSEW